MCLLGCLKCFIGIDAHGGKRKERFKKPTMRFQEDYKRKREVLKLELLSKTPCVFNRTLLAPSPLPKLPNAPETNLLCFSPACWKWLNYYQEEECEAFPGAVCDVRALRRPLRFRQPVYSREHSNSQQLESTAASLQLQNIPENMHAPPVLRWPVCVCEELLFTSGPFVLIIANTKAMLRAALERKTIPFTKKYLRLIYAHFCELQDSNTFVPPQQDHVTCSCILFSCCSFTFRFYSNKTICRAAYVAHFLTMAGICGWYHQGLDSTGRQSLCWTAPGHERRPQSEGSCGGGPLQELGGACTAPVACCTLPEPPAPSARAHQAWTLEVRSTVTQMSSAGGE